jgi:heptosyltransferase-3
MKILLTQLRQIGDVLLCTPSLELIRNKYPGAEVHFLAETVPAQVLICDPRIDKLHIVNRHKSVGAYFQLAVKLRRERYSDVIDFLCNPTSAQLVRITGARRRIGFQTRNRNYAYTHTQEWLSAFVHSYAARSKAALLTPLAIANTALPPIRMFCDTAEEDYADAFWRKHALAAFPGVIALCPVSRRERKLWSAEKWAWIADALVKQTGYRLWLVYGPGEYDFAARVAEHMQQAALLSSAIPDLRQKYALFKRFNLFLGNDGGNKHIAVAAGIPTVTVFIRINPENWTPDNDPRHVAFAEGNPGQPQPGQVRKEDVLKYALQLLSA